MLSFQMRRSVSVPGTRLRQVPDSGAFRPVVCGRDQVSPPSSEYDRNTEPNWVRSDM